MGGRRAKRTKLWDSGGSEGGSILSVYRVLWTIKPARSEFVRCLSDSREPCVLNIVRRGASQSEIWHSGILLTHLITVRL